MLSSIFLEIPLLWARRFEQIASFFVNENLLAYPKACFCWSGNQGDGTRSAHVVCAFQLFLRHIGVPIHSISWQRTLHEENITVQT